MVAGAAVPWRSAEETVIPGVPGIVCAAYCRTYQRNWTA